MAHRRLERIDLKVSEIRLGTTTFAGHRDESASIQILDRAVENRVGFAGHGRRLPDPPSPGPPAGPRRPPISRDHLWWILPQRPVLN